MLVATACALYLFAPLLVSVAFSAVVHRYDLFPSLAFPMDGGAMLGGHRLFGDGKTWRGLAIAVVGSIATVAVQKYVLADVTRGIALIDYAGASSVALGTAFGAGAIAGELPNSFAKRRLGIERGETAKRPLARIVFWTWDQIDSVTLMWLFLLPWLRPMPWLVLTTLVLALVLHPMVAWVGWAIGARATAR